jgi:hypothetical protein
LRRTIAVYETWIMMYDERAACWGSLIARKRCERDYKQSLRTRIFDIIVQLVNFHKPSKFNISGPAHASSSSTRVISGIGVCN